MSNIQSTPTLIINGQVFPIKANSLEITLGLGESKVNVESFGGDQLAEIIGEDITTRIGKISFKMYNTSENFTSIADLKINGSKNTIQFTTSQGIGGSMSKAIMTNDVKAIFSPDGEIDVNIEGSQIKFG
jgi:hypothetical protein